MTLPLYLNLHDLMTVRADRLSKGIHEFLVRQLGLFKAPDPGGNHVPDIRICPMEPPADVCPADRHMSILFGFWMTSLNGSPAVVYPHRGKPDLMVVFSDVIIIHYRKRPGIELRLYSNLLFCIRFVLHRKKAVFCHGAVVTKGKDALMICGHRGSNKTLLTLSLLNKGWQYLSDDKFILHNGRALMVQSFLSLKGHHTFLLPWIKDVSPGCRSFAKKAGQKRRLMAFAFRYTPKQFLSAADRLFNPSMKLDPAEITGEKPTRKSVSISACVLLTHGAQIKTTPISPAEFSERFSAIQSLLFSEFTPLETMLSYYSPRMKQETKPIVEENISGIRFYSISMPGGHDLQRLCQEVYQCLS